MARPRDRRWPGSKRANIDFLLVGPGGLVVLDDKCWAEMEVREGRLYRGQAPEDEEIAKLTALTDAMIEGLHGIGLAASTIHAAIVFQRRRIDARAGGVAVLGDEDLPHWLARLPLRLDRHQAEEVVAAVDQCCPPMPEQPQPRAGAPRAVVPLADEPALLDVDQLTQDLMETALAGPLEQWMTFLHPEQNRLISAQWNGPSRVRGPAGTGKTVVGLHRAVHLARRHRDPVLFVSYVRTLPVVLGALARRLDPAAAERIEFVGVHALAYRCLEDVGETIRGSSYLRWVCERLAVSG